MTDLTQTPLEPLGSIDGTYRSPPGGPMGATLDPAVLGNVKSPRQYLLYKDQEDNIYGTAPFGQQQKQEGSQSNAQKKAKDNSDSKAPANQQSTNPTVASQPAGSILQAIKAADPNNTSGAVKKALDAMISLTMMSRLATPAGISGIMSGALNGALTNIANQIGLGPVLQLMNNVMPGMSSQLNSFLNSAVNQAVNGLLANTKTGVLSTQAATTATAAVGGATIGLDPTSLAALVAVSPAGTTLNVQITVDGVTCNVQVYVTTNDIQLSLQNVPSFTGVEHIDLANATADTMAADILYLIQQSNGVNNVTPAAMANIINNHNTNIQSQGLQMLIGFGINSLLGNLNTILGPQMGGLIGGLLGGLGRSYLNPGVVNTSMQNASRVIGIARQIYNIANMFGSTQSEQVQNSAHAAAVQAASTGKPVTVNTPNATITATPVGSSYNNPVEV
jgi:hypothetical protein